jgi:hypothetical protein
MLSAGRGIGFYKSPLHLLKKPALTAGRGDWQLIKFLSTEKQYGIHILTCNQVCS